MFGWVDDDMRGFHVLAGTFMSSFDHKRSQILQTSVTLDGVTLFHVRTVALDVFTTGALFVLRRLVADDFFRFQAIPKHVGDLIARTKVRIRVAVTVQTPRHAERFGLSHHFHLVDTTVTCCATNTRGDVHLVVEEGIVRQHVNIHPANRFVLFVTKTHLRQLLALGQNLRVTTHTDLCGRDGGVARFVHCVVAVATVQSQRSRVKFVTEGYRLLRSVTYIGEFGRKPVPDAKDGKQSACSQATQCNKGCPVRPSRKYDSQDQVPFGSSGVDD